MADTNEQGPQEVIDLRSGGASMASSLIQGEVDSQIATAKRYPRSVSASRDLAKQLATTDEQTAKECRYAVTRAGKIIDGPSIRMAEILMYSWGNNRVAGRIIGEDGDGHFIVTQGAFIDLQQNVGITREVRRRITNKQGVRFSDDMIGVTANAAVALAIRNAVLTGIPKALWREVDDAVKETITGNAATFKERIAAMMTDFKSHGVNGDSILKLVGRRRMVDLEPDDFVKLQAVFQSIKDDPARLAEVFRLDEGGSKTGPERAREAMRDRVAKGLYQTPDAGSSDTLPDQGEGKPLIDFASLHPVWQGLCAKLAEKSNINVEEADEKLAKHCKSLDEPIRPDDLNEPAIEWLKAQIDGGTIS